ncbi:MAG: FHA domain-containing protein [Chloroflexota bacterium]
MSILGKKLDELESRLKMLIEGRIARLLPAAEISKADLLGLLKDTLETGVQQQSDGRSLAPDIFHLVTHPQHALQQSGNELLLQELAVLMERAGEEAGFYFLKAPRIILISEDQILPERIEIDAQISGMNQLEETSALEIVTKTKTEHIPASAFLIVNGDQVYSLEESIVNIGRSAGNDLVIDDGRVSRRHAQLRAVRGRFLLFDLDSTGGTYVNGVRTQQSTLHPQDVISLAGVPLVFGQENAPTLDQTRKLDAIETNENSASGKTL